MAQGNQHSKLLFTLCLDWMIWNSFFLFLFPKWNYLVVHLQVFLVCKESQEAINTVLSHPLCLFPGRWKTSTFIIFAFFQKKKMTKVKLVYKYYLICSLLSLSIQSAECWLPAPWRKPLLLRCFPGRKVIYIQRRCFLPKCAAHHRDIQGLNAFLRGLSVLTISSHSSCFFPSVFMETHLSFQTVSLSLPDRMLPHWWRSVSVK